MTIVEIYKSENISIRSVNICLNNGLKDLSAILDYFLVNKTFQNLRNCGTKSNKELISLCKKYIYKNQIDKPLHQVKKLDVQILNFSRNQREIVNTYIELKINNLTNRSRNAISQYLNKNFKIKNIGQIIFNNNDFNYANIKNIGNNTASELKIMFDEIRDYIEKVAKIDDENEILILRNRFYIERLFSITSIPDEILSSKSIFTLIHFLIRKDAIFEKNEKFIFEKTVKIYKNQLTNTRHEISKELNISVERVRQIQKNILKKLFDKLLLLKNIDSDLYEKYSLDINQHLIIIDDDFSNLINHKNATNFSAEFNALIVYSCISDQFNLVGHINDVLQSKFNKSSKLHNWSNIYLISKNINDQFDFNNYTNDIYYRINDKIKESYNLNFKGYLNNFIRNKNNDFLSFIIPVAERIINHEFDLFIDINDNIVFKRNTFKQVFEYAIEALEKLGAPSNIEDIYRLIEVDYPEITKNQEALRGSLGRSPEIIYFGRSSTFGLKKWEIEKEGIKGGTIKDIIFEYLQDKTYPVHILELLSEVHKYRKKTNAKNIITNLKLDPQKQFMIFNQSFIGLSDKIYKSNLTSLPKFLGKTITNYINQQGYTNRIIIEEYFSVQLKISKINMRYIVDYLIEQQFVSLDNQNNLSI